jgi:aminoglycoside phosphotransferase (APT) family kinase protein
MLPFRLRHEQFEGFAGQERPAGIPPEQDYLAAYCRRTGRAGVPHWDWYVAFAMFRLAAIAQGIMGRVVAGTANDPNAVDRGRRARPLAETAWAIIERLTA